MILLASDSVIRNQKKGQKQSRNWNCDYFGTGIDTALDHMSTAQANLNSFFYLRQGNERPLADFQRGQNRDIPWVDCIG